MRKPKLLKISFVIGFALMGLFFLVPHKAVAATFTVDSVADDIDDNAGDGNCDNGSGDCTLRAAIEEANALPGNDEVEFSISGGGVKTIAPATAFPQIIERLDIDGTTQPGSACGTLVPTTLPGSNTTHTLLIEISGEDMSPAGNLFDYREDESAGSILRGLILNRVQNGTRAVDIQNGANDMTIECNYIGSNASGSANVAIIDDNENAQGIVINTSSNNIVQNNLFVGWNTGISASNPAIIRNNLIGTNAAGNAALPNQVGISATSSEPSLTIEHNIISGNSTIGINTHANVNVRENFIGLSLSGSPLGNEGDGIYLNSGTASTIIGSSSSKNVISANGGSGIHLERDSECENNVTDTSIIGNYIGTNVSGTVASDYGNREDGITVNETHSSCGGSVYKHIIGGSTLNEQNVIAGNARDGIRIYSVPWETCDDDGEGGDPPVLCNGTDVFSISVLANKIYQNGGLNIELATDSDNDGDADGDIGQNPLNTLLIDYPATKANNFLNSPVIHSASAVNGQLSINYDYTAQAVSTENTDEIAQDNLVGYRLDFYINGKDHLGSFMVDGSEDNASHTFSYSGEVTDQTTINATATILWRIYTAPECEGGHRVGNGPPYGESAGCE